MTNCFMIKQCVQYLKYIYIYSSNVCKYSKTPPVVEKAEKFYRMFSLLEFIQ